MRGRYLAVLLLFLTIFCVSSLAFKVEISPANQKILFNESAVFNLTIKHSSFDNEVFEMYSPDILWDIRSKDVLVVPSHEVLNTKIVVRPLNVNQGIYGVPLIFKEFSSGETVEKRLMIELVSKKTSSSGYLPAIKGDVELDSVIDPRDPFNIKLNLENLNRRDLPVVNVKIRSSLINKDYSTQLLPLERKTVEFKVDLDPFVEPQEDVLYITLLVPEEEKAYQFDLFPTPVRVIDYGGIEENVSVEKSFLKTFTHVKLMNKGNGGHFYVYPYETGSLSRLFLSSNKEMVLRGENYEWDFFLEPKQKENLYIEVNYRPFFWIILAVFVLLLAYYFFRSPISLKKSARVVRTRDGGISDIKVVINIRHRGNRKVRNFELIDLVPNIAEIIEEKNTTIDPVSITKSEHKGTLMKWKIASIDPKEHRILTYSVRSKLSILGGLKLPMAVAKFNTDYYEKEVTSNSAIIKFSSE